MVGENVGPPLHSGSEEEQRSFDSTCRKLHAFLMNTVASYGAQRDQAIQPVRV